jgi:Zn-finger nucleic acid-binding protein
MKETGVCPWCYERVEIDMGPSQGWGWDGECPRCKGSVVLDDAGEWAPAELEVGETGREPVRGPSGSA